MVAGQITSAAMMLLASALTLGTTSVNAGELDVLGAGAFVPRAAPLIKDYKRAASKTYSVAHDYSGGSLHTAEHDLGFLMVKPLYTDSTCNTL